MFRLEAYPQTGPRASFNHRATVAERLWPSDFGQVIAQVRWRMLIRAGGGSSCRQIRRRSGLAGGKVTEPVLTVTNNSSSTGTQASDTSFASFLEVAANHSSSVLRSGSETRLLATQRLLSQLLIRLESGAERVPGGALVRPTCRPTRAIRGVVVEAA